MPRTLLESVSSWYLLALIGGFTVVALWETVRPLRAPTMPLAQRWLTNIGLQAINQALLVSVFPLLTLGAALEAQARGWGLMAGAGLPAGVALVLGLLALDALRWGLHAALHHLPWLWRFHRVHHSDLDYDCTIGLRFHPLEALFGQAILLLAIVALGLSPWAVLLSELLTIAHGYFAHGNVSLPSRIDRLLRRWIVTPDLHRVHHSTRPDESMSNFGSILALWDQGLGTWRAAPVAGHLGMEIGLQELRDPGALTLPRLLLMPFRR